MIKKLTDLYHFRPTILCFRKKYDKSIVCFALTNCKMLPCTACTYLDLGVIARGQCYKITLCSHSERISISRKHSQHITSVELKTKRRQWCLSNTTQDTHSNNKTTEITTTSRESQDTETLIATITKNIIFVRPLSRVTSLMMSVEYTRASATRHASLWCFFSLLERHLDL